MELNAYIRTRVIKKGKNIDSTVMQEVRRIIGFINWLSGQGKGYEEATSSKIRVYRDKFEGVQNKVRNDHTRSIHAFLWFCEYTLCSCEGVVGITDAANGVGPYPVQVDPPKSRGLKYSIPHLLPENVSQRLNIGSARDWDKAYITSANDPSPRGMRNHLMMRLIREGKLRQIALRHICCSEFERELTPEEIVSGKFFIHVVVDKYGKEHDVPISTDLFYEISDYINGPRCSIVSTTNEYLFAGSKKNTPLAKRTINDIFENYGIAPHDGRAIGATERFMELIDKGHSEQDCLLIVSEEMGHSLKGEGETLRRFYLLAKEAVEGGQFQSVAELRLLGKVARTSIVGALDKLDGNDAAAARNLLVAALGRMARSVRETT